ncbi:MAG: aspartate carbamoyltransferase catalytic subunit [Phycisphaerales bacterium]|nr:aspartate carbamoyltransferase catalytic subunit [Phycisphaerales bacterium]
MAWNGRNFVDIRDLDRNDLLSLLSRASAYRDREPVVDPGGPLAGAVIANLFFENSTRTRCSFTMATKRLGGDVLDLLGSTSSTSKGETILDTARNVAAMGVRCLVIRCSQDGGPAMIAKSLDTPVINAGDGVSGHPTQAMLDALALIRFFGADSLDGRKIAIVGDIAHSRVARSNMVSLPTLGAEVALVGPEDLLPKTTDLETFTDLDAALPGCDAVIMLRVQFERDATINDDYRDQFALTRDRMSTFDGVVLHPGPMNRGLEIDDAVADGKRSLVLEQVACGVAVRMAILEHIVRT